MRYGFLFLATVVYGQQPDVLLPDRPVERELRAGETHVYTVTLDAGAFGYLYGKQGDTDFRIRLKQEGRRTIVIDRAPFGGFEDIPWIAETSGSYQVEVAAVGPTVTGRYQLRFETRRPSPADEKRAQAFRLAWVEGRVAVNAGQASQAAETLQKLETAIRLFAELGDGAWQTYTVLIQSQVEQQRGKYREAMGLLEGVRTVNPASEPYQQSVVWNGLATMHSSLGNYSMALEMYEKALEIRRAHPADKANMATLLANIGLVRKNLGQLAKAAEAMDAALALQRQVGNPDRIARFMSNLSAVHMLGGDYQRSLELSTEVYRLYTGKATPSELGGAALQLGNVYHLLGQRTLALGYWQRAAELYRQAGYRPGLASTMYSIGQDAMKRGDYIGAVKAYEEGLNNLQQQTVRINLLVAMCGARVELRDFEEARKAAREAKQLAESAGYRVGAASASACLGQLELRGGNKAEAKQRLEDAVRTYQDANTPEDELVTRLALAKLAQSEGNRREALTQVERAAQLEEASRSRLADADSRATYRGARADLLSLRTTLLMQQHREEPGAGHDRKALGWTERWRARSLTELIAGSSLRRDLTPEQRENEDRILQNIRNLQRELFQEDVPAARQAELRRQLGEQEAGLERMQVELRQGGSKYAEAAYAKVLDAAGMQQELLEANAVMVVYALGAGESYGWAVTREGVVSATLPGRDEIEGQVEAYRKLLSERVTALTAARSQARIDALGVALHRVLLQPFEAALRARTSLIVVPDGALAYLPFESLGRTAPLLQTMRVRYAPAASTLAALRQRDAERRAPSLPLLAFADPARAGGETGLEAYRERGFAFTALPNARKEVSGLQSLFGDKAEVYTGEQAHESVLATKDLAAYRYLHFAAHGYFDAEYPDRSGIVLAAPKGGDNDGILQGQEVVRMRLNADLVTLSACQTGLGKLMAAEGVMGLSRTFLHAGAQSVVVSLWNVNDAATAELMRHFYAGLKAGLARDEALRQAKLKLRRTPGSPWRHPYFWAPFVLIGEN
ncbi:MAG: CHAT domain-containing protein [Bryobacterales bacterium]|nr:CHAT domain-containing protein [Bryobacterales bacterium]